ncbi:carbohydrate ABC transporter permease [Streptacidiphilus carbonis]|uniref:carbohydrate ABC transporter permease n=1 Tax=Streptacidiphilus carbonis TaxID=105422 RepID=UPI000693CC44|nr:sugar ABC transporter permease [Streptacidiphilus carbonis]
MAAIAVLESTTEPGPGSRRNPRRQDGFVRELRRNVSAYGFLVGALLCFGLFSWYPMVREFIMSFQKQKLGRTRWVGMHNFNQIWNDPSFGQAWRNTLYFTLLALLLGYLVPFLVAIVLNEFRHASAYLRIVVYLPVMLPPVASLVLFQYFYNPEYGLFDHILHAVGLPTLQWLQSPNTSMIAVVIASTWMNMGSATLIYLAALQGIPGELYEAAEIDGAGILRRVWHVTIPQTRMILSMLLMLQIVATMQVFVEPFVLTNGGQGVDNSTTTIVYLVYQYAFNFSNYGAASALGLLLLLVLVVFAVIYRWISRRAEQ